MIPENLLDGLSAGVSWWSVLSISCEKLFKVRGMPPYTQQS